ncbi:DUF2892 domain-containing protein [Ferrovibrio terrae]|uniref:DUF2892 domain-containing protein n=1 Tax=Ferrovibrio terrae TaxID=2594003 RepID=A0A516H448_9PROT|nr:DUF2892 domain-containing protein [Ferrovibrio terrae]QDO98537.1 DUF2892 domain-containing protein [Ferrovibrio terrae]
MQSNVGDFDRILRIVAGILLLTFAAIYQGEERWFGLIGVVPLLTGLFRFCPAYTLLGIATCRR